jgi:hypothetical protein
MRMSGASPATLPLSCAYNARTDDLTAIAVHIDERQGVVVLVLEELAQLLFEPDAAAVLGTSLLSAAIQLRRKQQQH